MNKKVKLNCIAILLAPSIAFGADLDKKAHKDVTTAMAYTLPKLKCQQPVLPGKSRDVVDPNGSVTRLDVDSYQLGRYNRAEKRWKKCVTQYKTRLMEDFDELKGSAAHGLTGAQAKTILANMATVQAALIAPDAIPKPETKPESDDS
ncbi:MAG: hypothetical protein ACJAYE_003120 [Candidatus Azotimanducaceae bacterium]|jgi:hypothetical protein